MVDNSPSFQKDQVCETVFATLAAEIGAFGTNVNLRVNEAERIAIEDKIIKSMPDSQISSQVICRRSLELKNSETHTAKPFAYLGRAH